MTMMMMHAMHDDCMTMMHGSSDPCTAISNGPYFAPCPFICEPWSDDDESVEDPADDDKPTTAHKTVAVGDSIRVVSTGKKGVVKQIDGVQYLIHVHFGGTHWLDAAKIEPFESGASNPNKHTAAAAADDDDDDDGQSDDGSINFLVCF